MMTVPLGGKRAAGRVALVDDQDWELDSQYRWHIFEVIRAGRNNGPYAVTTIRLPDGKRCALYMHNLVMGRLGVDHQNHDGLDNQRANLRPATRDQNMHNLRSRIASSSSFKGVSWDRGNRKWKAQIVIGGRKRHLGLFAAGDDAARAYDAAALAAWGEYAWLNFPAGRPSA